MLREAVALLPDALVRCPLGTAMGCCTGGAILWLMGGRLSRSVLALVAVATGSVIGLHLPQWQGWQIDGMALAIAGAIILGTCAFLMHRTCIGLLLGMTLTAWAGFGTWILMASNATWNWRAAKWQGDGVQYLHDLWQTLPPGMGRIFPWACFGGFALGVSITVLSPKLGKVLAHSVIGVTLMVLMGSVAANITIPNSLSRVPGTNAGQMLALAALVMLGAVIQWQITPPHRRKGGAVNADSGRKE